MFTATLSAPARSRASASSTDRTPPAHGEGEEDRIGHSPDHVEDDGPRVGGRRDVEEHELVGSLGVVPDGALHGISRVAQRDELHALDHAAPIDVEAGNETLGQHQCLFMREKVWLA